MYVLLKALLSGAIIAVASEATQRSSLLGAILVSLPLTSILAITWLYRDTHDTAEVVDLSWSILWVIVPSLLFFIVLPWRSAASRSGLRCYSPARQLLSATPSGSGAFVVSALISDIPVCVY